MGDFFMIEKLSSIEEKNEYEKIKSDYSNDYGYNLGFNSKVSSVNKEDDDKIVNELLNIKKR